jgi:hypothetical protein
MSVSHKQLLAFLEGYQGQDVTAEIELLPGARSVVLSVEKNSGSNYENNEGTIERIVGKQEAKNSVSKNRDKRDVLMRQNNTPYSQSIGARIYGSISDALAVWTNTEL